MLFMNFLGNPIMALFISAIVTDFVLGLKRGFSLDELGKQTEACMGPMASIILAIGAGAIGASHVTDSGFWFVKECLGIPMKDMYATFTLSTCIAAVAGLIGVLLVAQLV